MNEVTILSEEELRSMDRETLNDAFISSAYGSTHSIATDFTKILSGFSYANYDSVTTTRDVDKKGNVCIKGLGDYYYASFLSKTNNIPINSRGSLIRLAVKNPFESKYSNIIEKSSYDPIKFSSVYKFGEYPQKRVKKYSSKLEKLYKKGELKKTGKKYTFDKVPYDDKYNEFDPVEYEEYMDDQGEKFIRYFPNKDIDLKYQIGLDYLKTTEPVWIQVKPLYWVYDSRTDTMITTHNILSGLQFANKEYYGNFETSDLAKYLDRYFSKEMLPIRYYTLEKEVEGLEEYPNIVDACFKIVDSDKLQDFAYDSTSELIYCIHDMYPNLSENDCKTVASVILKVQSKIMKDPEEIKKEKNRQIELENNVQKIMEEEKLAQQLIAKAELNDFMEEIARTIPKDLSYNEMVEYIYRLRPTLTDDELKTIINKIELRKMGNESIDSSLGKKENSNEKRVI